MLLEGLLILGSGIDSMVLERFLRGMGILSVKKLLSLSTSPLSFLNVKPVSAAIGTTLVKETGVLHSIDLQLWSLGRDLPVTGKVPDQFTASFVEIGDFRGIFSRSDFTLVVDWQLSIGPNF